jgi:hypothetical protein
MGCSRARGAALALLKCNVARISRGRASRKKTRVRDRKAHSSETAAIGPNQVATVKLKTGGFLLIARALRQNATARQT